MTFLSQGRLASLRTPKSSAPLTVALSGLPAMEHLEICPICIISFVVLVPPLCSALSITVAISEMRGDLKLCVLR